MQQDSIKRSDRGRPRLLSHRRVADTRDNSRTLRSYLRGRSVCITIPRTSNERRREPFDPTCYRRRNSSERLIDRLKQFRRIATRYEKRAINFLATLTLAAILLWL